MNADVIPMVLIMYLVCLLFGIGYDRLVEWVHKNNVWHVSISVVIGVSVTCFILVGFLFGVRMEGWLFGLILFGAFSMSGLPMVVGSTRRDVKDKKQKRPLGNTNARLRDEAVVELSMIANELSEQVKRDALTLRDLPDLVNRLHLVKGILKNM